MRRALNHLFVPHWVALRPFPAPVLRQEARSDTAALTTDLIVGSMTLAVRTK